MNSRTFVTIAALVLAVGCADVQPVENPLNPQTERGKDIATFRPKPPYPLEARRRHIQGYGVAVLWIRPDGTVSRAEMIRSTGHAILDEATLDAYRRWQFKPGVVKKVKIPVTFSM
jgi:protein TonB